MIRQNDINLKTLLIELNAKFGHHFHISASGLQLFIASDGTASLGNHEVKSRMSGTVFKVVNPR